jgi:hypothetical protein
MRGRGWDDGWSRNHGLNVGIPLQVKRQHSLAASA